MKRCHPERSATREVEEPQTLQREILRAIAAWHEKGVELSDGAFDDLALRVFAHQLRRNAPYARYCAAKGVTLERFPRRWHEIPAVPSAAYKEAALTTFDPSKAALTFQTSGTTQGAGGVHSMESSALYDAALLAGFDRLVLADGARLRYLNLVPNPKEKPSSSLGYMMARIARLRGSGATGWYVRGEALLLDEFFDNVRDAAARAQPLCIATTAFALVAVLDAAEARGVRLRLAGGSRIMETGGFKGRTRVLSRDELYERTCRWFGVSDSQIIAEYGMTELTSQWYDSVPRLRQAAPTYARDDKNSPSADSKDKPNVVERARLKVSPTWLRARAVATDGTTLPDGVVGALAHVDLANLSSCVAVQTEDLGARFGNELVLIGREQGAELRGCSLDAETLAAR